MIQWDLDSAGHPLVKQEFKRPAVYLDHWAIRLFAADRALATRFSSALEARQGTRAVSLLNLMEYINMKDEDQAAQFEDLLEQALPNLFFIDFQAFDVMEREKAMLQGGSRNAPYGVFHYLAPSQRCIPTRLALLLPSRSLQASS
jgi:hypothetical protein